MAAPYGRGGRPKVKFVCYNCPQTWWTNRQLLRCPKCKGPLSREDAVEDVGSENVRHVERISSRHLQAFMEDLGVERRDVKHLVMTITPPGRVLVVLTRYERNEYGQILIDEFEDEPKMETVYGDIDWDWRG